MAAQAVVVVTTPSAVYKGIAIAGAVFTPAGRLIRIFEHVQDLNSPWGLALAPGDFGAFSHHLLVGQFGSGEILAYNVVPPVDQHIEEPADRGPTGQCSVVRSAV